MESQFIVRQLRDSGFIAAPRQGWVRIAPHFYIFGAARWKWKEQLLRLPMRTFLAHVPAAVDVDRLAGDVTVARQHQGHARDFVQRLAGKRPTGIRSAFAFGSISPSLLQSTRERSCLR